MTGSIRALLQNTLDYAGLFPPAQLPVAPALANFARYRAEADAWMLGRFVCPAVRLGELLPLRDTWQPGSLPLTVLGRGGKDPKEFFDNVRADLADASQCLSALGDRATVDSYEVRLPTGVFDPPRANQLAALIGTVAYLIETSNLPGLTPFFECPVLETRAVQALLKSFQDDRQSADAGRRRKCGPPGWKLRCGGTEAAAFPTPAQVALVLAACCAAGIPWKGTAGMHHPLRHVDAAMQVHQHGFINVFVAGVLAHANQINEVQIVELLQDTDASHFVFDDDGLRWRHFHADNVAITVAREMFMTSFGSCSFDEPRQDLRGLSWL